MNALTFLLASFLETISVLSAAFGLVMLVIFVVSERSLKNKRPLRHRLSLRRSYRVAHASIATSVAATGGLLALQILTCASIEILLGFFIIGYALILGRRQPWIQIAASLFLWGGLRTAFGFI